MKDHWVYTDKIYRPKLNASDEYGETADQYCSRMKALLPNFPPDVLAQWFYRHWSHIDDYAWIDFNSLSFNKELWPSEKVMSSGIKEKQTVQTDRNHYESGHRYQRQEAIISYFELHGTWPVAPIFLSNTEIAISFPDGRLCTVPYHLIEGHHRAAIFWSYFDRKKVINMHEVWVSKATEITEAQYLGRLDE